MFFPPHFRKRVTPKFCLHSRGDLHSPNLWWEAINAEMKNVRVEFEVFEGDITTLPNNFSEVKCHMIFDIKMSEDFRRKARMVAGGGMLLMCLLC